MPVQVVLGGQWGDEGKGKIVDTLCENVNIVARFQGGANAGHTIYKKGKKFVLHQLPSGILEDGVNCLMGHGMVIDPIALLSEIEEINENGLHTENRIRISPYATIITPLHKEQDRLKEDKNGKSKKIGTTKKGIGPAYSDHINRVSLKAVSLSDPEALKLFMDKQYRHILKLYSNLKPVDDFKKEFDEFYQKAAIISKYVQDFSLYLNEAIDSGKKVMVEGAQGLLLDINYGTYPFVTSSNTGSGGVLTGLPISYKKIDKVTGIFKAYTTRVGNGPFPTELFDNNGERLQKIGNEFGATTGRPRRCGWFDAVLAKYSVIVNGIDDIILTKLDVLSEFDEIAVCTGYEYKGKTVDTSFALMHLLEDVKPVYTLLEGWKTDISGIAAFEELPEKTQKYIQFLESVTSAKISMISTGMNREDIIIR